MCECHTHILKAIEITVLKENETRSIKRELKVIKTDVLAYKFITFLRLRANS